MQKTLYHIKNNPALPEQGNADIRFEKTYLNLRQKEKRIYTDNELAILPLASKNNPHYSEWKIREQSCRRLVSYLQKKNSPLKILEVGCGNGWLSHRLSAVRGTSITATDINSTELSQAKRVFGNISNLQFVYGNISSGLFEDEQFDILVFAASIQYFPSLTDILRNSLNLLRPGGEIHIIDSHFYKADELQPAFLRTEAYFQQLDMPEMAAHYFHHGVEELSAFNYTILYKQSGVAAFFQRNNNPFTWICIKNNEN